MDVSDLESQLWTGGNLQPREVPPGLSRSASYDHTLPIQSVTTPEICPQFLFILLDHRGIEIIIRIFTVKESQDGKIDLKNKASVHGIWDLLILAISCRSVHLFVQTS